MTCSDVMTTTLKCCYPTDTVKRAAEIMRDEDVGPVPVVSPDTGKLIGIVTDRDIAIQAVARGRDCSLAEVGDIMSRDLVSCSPGDDYTQALKSMSTHQVRRIPVVNPDGTIAGMISQADVARFSNESETGRVVEDISGGAGLGGLTMPASQAPSLWMCAAGFAMGAACMYMFDPDRGRTRRALTRDKAARLYNDSAWVAGKIQRDLMNRTTGTMAGMKQQFAQGEETVPESKLLARVRSKMGHYVSHPHGIQVSCTGDGCIHLSGEIPADEMTSLLSAIRSVPGVRAIENRLNTQQSAEGSTNRIQTLSPAMRFITGVLGGSLAVLGMRSSGTVAKAAGTVGLGLVASGVANMPFTNLASSMMHPSASQSRQTIH